MNSERWYLVCLFFKLSALSPYRDNSSHHSVLLVQYWIWGLGVITNNAILILVFLLLFTGIYFGCTGKKQKTAREFLMADRSMSIVPVSMSMLARYDLCCVPNSYWPECSDTNEVEEVVPTCHHCASWLVIATSCIRIGVQTPKCIWLMNMWPNV